MSLRSEDGICEVPPYPWREDSGNYSFCAIVSWSFSPRRSYADLKLIVFRVGTLNRYDSLYHFTFFAMSRVEGSPSLASDSSNAISEFDSNTTCAIVEAFQRMLESILA